MLAPSGSIWPNTFSRFTVPILQARPCSIDETASLDEVLLLLRKNFLPSCLWLALEACGGCSLLGAREIANLGHDVRLIPPAYVKPFVKRGKTDAADAEAISEAVIRKTMRFVPIRTAEQQADAMVLKTRALLVQQRTQSVNALRAHLAELGIIAAGGLPSVAALMTIVREGEDTRLPAAARFALMAASPIRSTPWLIRSSSSNVPSLRRQSATKTCAA